MIVPSSKNYMKDEIPTNCEELKEDKNKYNSIQLRIKRKLSARKLPWFEYDNYTIQKNIGQGSYGQLFSAINNKTKKLYAIKELICQELNSLDDYIKGLYINYENKHENILDIYGIHIIISDEKLISLYALMDLGECDWENEINKRIELKNYYSEDELIYILRGLASALAFLQRKNVAHRDIKLENILLFPNNDKKTNKYDKIYKICDFGEAKQRIKYNTKHNTVRGTDYYMSPQLLNGLNNKKDYVKNNPYKSDVFSLGCCMIIAATLELDFIEDIRNEDKQEEVDDLITDKLKNNYSDKFINIILKMIAYNETSRIDCIDLENLIKKEY